MLTGPARSNLDESISTLRFASTTKNIKNKAIINEDAKDALLRRFQEQIEELRQQLASEGEDPELAEQMASDQNAIVPSEIVEKLKSLENKICVGGENLIEKAELQQQMIAEREAELQLRRNKEMELRTALEQRQQEILTMEDSYGSLQEEINALNKKIKKVFTI